MTYATPGPMHGRDVTGLMRRINALEVGVTTLAFNRKWGSAGTGDGEFNVGAGPCTIYVYEDEVYVTDRANNRLQVFTTDGTFVRKFGTAGSGAGQMSEPINMFVYNDEVYVTERGNNRVQVFSLTGTYARMWGSSGTADGQFQEPSCVYVYNDEVYVTDYGNNRVQVFNVAGAFQRKWGTLGSGDSQFHYPTGIMEYDGNIWVGDSQNAAVKAFTPAGVFVSKLDPIGAIPGSGLTDYAGLFVYNGKLYITDGGYHYIYTYDVSTGALCTQWGGYGSGDGLLAFPEGVFVYGDETYVADSYNHRIQVFAMDPLSQTPWYWYTTSAKTSLGTPDGGVSVPGDNDLVTNPALLARNHITDMRTAIEALVGTGSFINPATSNPYNWTPASADNLYYCAVDRTTYGGPAGADYDWWRADNVMAGTPCYRVDIGEIEDCVAALEAVV